ncbi:hypothetical protein Tco_0280636 [Tanacetum coccineum]
MPVSQAENLPFRVSNAYLMRRDYWTGISSTGDFLTTVQSYTAIRESLGRLCHHLIAFTIARRGQTPEKVTTTDRYYLRSMDEGMHFRVITEESLHGLNVVVRDLMMIDMDELARLCICERLADVWAWVAPRPKRQQVAAAGAGQADQEIPEEGV